MPDRREIDRLIVTDGTVVDRLSVALGIVMSHLDLSGDEALAWMRVRAFRRNQTLHELAADVAAGIGEPFADP